MVSAFSGSRYLRYVVPATIVFVDKRACRLADGHVFGLDLASPFNYGPQ